jgi:hypothetical protein
MGMVDKPEAGIYYVKVYPYWPYYGGLPCSYTLTVRRSLDSLVIGEGKTGQIPKDNDVFWYQVAISGGSEPLFFHLDKASGADVGIAIYKDSLNNPLLRKEEASSDLMGMVDKPEAGIYYVKVYPYWPYYGGLPCSYTLTVRRSLEELTLGRMLPNQQLAKGGDIRWYQVSTPSNRKMFIALVKSLKWKSNVVVRYQSLYNPDIINSASYDDQILEIQSSQEGIYYIVVSGEGTYGILVSLDNRPIIVQSPKLPRYSMLSLPFYPSHPDPAVIIDYVSNHWARWNPDTQCYVYYSNDPQKFTYFTPAEAVPGRAYWAEFEQEETFKIVGYPPPTEEYEGVKYYSIPLSKGWNMIGCPSTQKVQWDLQAIKVKRGTQPPVPLGQALSVVSGYAWGWTGDGYGLIYDTSIEVGVWKTYLEPFGGYWIKAKENCNLLIPLSSTKRDVSKERNFKSRAPDEWLCQIIVIAGDITDKFNIFGSTKNPSHPLSGVTLPPLPCGEVAGLEAYFIRSSGGQESRCKVDLRQNISQREVWELNVDIPSSLRGEKIVITWPSLQELPKDVSLTLVDTLTGERRYMRTTTNYSFIAGREEISRRFQIIAEKGMVGLLRITDLQCVVNRGANPSVVIAFNLTSDAFTNVNIRSLNGNVVAQLEVAHRRQAGLNKVVWRGVDREGKPLPKGIYIVEVQAYDEEGRYVRAIRMVTTP